MSGHLIGCVKPLDLPTSHKLALVAFADSADDRTHIGFPGYEGVQEWATCSRGRAAELIRDLCEWGYLKSHKRGHRGQRAEYIVFPNGCCDFHRTPVEEPAVDVETLAQAAGVTLEQARLMMTALGSSSPGIASGAPDAIGGNVSSTPDPFSTPGENAGDNAGKGPDSVQDSRSNANAFTPKNTPLPPKGECSIHPTGHPNCRACGTTPRQRAAAAAKAADATRRAAAAAELERVRAASRASKPASPEAIAAAKAAARAATR